MTSISEFQVTVPGRPAPQGSKKHGAHGQLRESSVYLAPWRQAIKAAVYAGYEVRGIRPADLPLFRGPVAIGVTFCLSDEQLVDNRIDGRPDLDKLLRGLFDGLTMARLWDDDSRVVEIAYAGKSRTRAGWTGADLTVRSVA